MSNNDVLENNGNLSIQLYVKQTQNDSGHDVEELLTEVKNGQAQINISLHDMFTKLKDIGVEE